MIVILMMSAQLATPGLLKLKIFWNKEYNAIIFVLDVTNETSYVINFGNPRIYMISHNFNFIRIWPEKPIFVEGGFGSSSIIWY